MSEFFLTQISSIQLFCEQFFLSSTLDYSCSTSFRGDHVVCLDENALKQLVSFLYIWYILFLIERIYIDSEPNDKHPKKILVFLRASVKKNLRC